MTNKISDGNVIGKDLAIWNWHFFLRWQGRNAHEVLEDHWNNFVPILDSAVDWTDDKLSDKKPLTVPLSRQTSLRLAGKELSAQETISKGLESRTLLDAFVIGTAVAKTGDSSVTDINSIKDFIWNKEKNIYDQSEKYFLGDADCLWLEIPKKLRKTSVERLSKELLAEWTNDPNCQFQEIQLDFGYLGMPENPYHNQYVMFVLDSNDARNSGSYFLTWILPQILLTKLKVPILERLFEKELPKLQGLEDKINKKVNSSLNGPCHIEGIEENIDELSHLQVELIDITAKCEVFLETLKVNAENLNNTLSEVTANNRESQIKELILFPVQILVEQFQVDLRYSQVAATRVEKVLQGFNAMSQLRQARWDRITALMFGVFVVLGAAEMFPELTKEGTGLEWQQRLIGVLIFGVLIYFLTQLPSILAELKWFWRKTEWKMPWSRAIGSQENEHQLENTDTDRSLPDATSDIEKLNSVNTEPQTSSSKSAKKIQ